MTKGPIIRAGAIDPLTRRIPRLNALETFYEDWRDNFLDNTKWAKSVTSGGTVTVDVTTPGESGFPGGCRLSTSADAAGAAYLMTQRRIFPVQHGQTANRAIVHRSCLEWEMRPATITVFDNTVFFIGASTNIAGNRTTPSVVGCFLSSDAITLLSDNAGTETTQATTNTITLTNTPHKYLLTLDRVEGLRLFVDEVLEATITTNIPVATSALPFLVSVHNDSAAAAILDLGRIRAWVEDIA